MKTIPITKVTAEDLLQHEDHKIEIRTYMTHGYGPRGLTIECVDCNEVLCDFEITEA